MLPLASSGPPPEFWGMFAVIMGINAIIMGGCATGGYFIAKKYQQPGWLGALLGGFMGWMGLLIIWLIGHTQQQNRLRQEQERRYAEWWYATNGGQQQQPQVTSRTPYGWPGQQQPPAPPPQA